jgi:hypothetical protein
MVGCVSSIDVSRLAAKQLRVVLPNALILLKEPIWDFGEYKVPLNLVGPDGRQAEVRVEVLKTRRL